MLGDTYGPNRSVKNRRTRDHRPSLSENLSLTLSLWTEKKNLCVYNTYLGLTRKRGRGNHINPGVTKDNVDRRGVTTEKDAHWELESLERTPSRTREK